MANNCICSNLFIIIFWAKIWCNVKRSEWTKKRWKKEVWAVLSKLKRSDGKCMRCGKIKEKRYLHAHHLVPKSHGNYAMFCRDNIVCLCFYCHKMWWHGDSTWEEQRDLIKKWIGLDRYFEIKAQTTNTHKYTEVDYDLMLAELDKLLKEKEE